jgi:Mycoplasma protein of unknown function, DUF285
MDSACEEVKMSQMKIKDKNHLRSVIEDLMKAHGPNVSLNHLDVSSVIDMSGLFYGSGFNGAVDQWDVSNVLNMRGMFCKATLFNQPIENWNVSKVKDMRSMFRVAHAFNQSLDRWDVSNDERMDFMFSDAVEFNQPIGRWNVSKVEDVRFMFYDASNFEQHESFVSWKLGASCKDENFLRGKTFRHLQQQWVDRHTLLSVLPAERVDQNKNRPAL